MTNNEDKDNVAECYHISIYDFIIFDLLSNFYPVHAQLLLYFKFKIFLLIY